MCYYVKFRISNVGVFLIYEAFRNWAANFNALLAFAQSGGGWVLGTVALLKKLGSQGLDQLGPSA